MIFVMTVLSDDYDVIDVLAFLTCMFFLYVSFVLVVTSALSVMT